MNPYSRKLYITLEREADCFYFVIKQTLLPDSADIAVPKGGIRKAQYIQRELKMN